MSPEAPAVSAFRLAPLDSRGSREQDRATGYAAGWAAGARAAAEQNARERAALAAAHEAAEARRDAAVATAVDRLTRAAAAADARTAPVIVQSRAALNEAALALAEAVLGCELSDGPTSARSALARALQAPADLGVHTLRLAPADHALLLAEGGVPDQVELVADPGLAPGDVIAEHPAGYLDARIGAALERARLALLGQDA